MEDHGTVYETRTLKMREQIEAMKEIWAKEGFNAKRKAAAASAVERHFAGEKARNGREAAK
jgi:hypothetical protein